MQGGIKDGATAATLSLALVRVVGLLFSVALLRLAHTTLGGIAIVAAIQLGIPRLAAVNAIRVINRAFASSARHTAFDQAVDNLVEHLDDTDELVDYGRRRDALRTWQIPPDHWRDLIRRG